MQTTEVLRVLGPALLAGVVATGVTVAIERWGGRLGGLIGTLPSTIVPASLGIASISARPQDFQDAMYVTPVGMLLNALFLYLWRWLPPRLPAWSLRARLGVMVTSSLLAWGLGAWVTVQGIGALRRSELDLMWVGAGVTALIAGVGLLACRQAPPAPRGRRPVGLWTLLGRGVMAAGAIGVAVYLASVGGPVAAGMATTFPAIFVTAMVSLWLAQGESVQVGAVGPMMLGSTSVAAYSLLAAWCMPSLGLAAGAAVSWLLAACCVTWPAWLYLRRRT